MILDYNYIGDDGASALIESGNKNEKINGIYVCIKYNLKYN